MISQAENKITEENAVEQKVSLPGTDAEIYLKRLDLVHPEISGNKWFKLKYNLEAAREKNYNTILTFGGAYSNHIHATAAAGKIFGFQTIGIVRGEENLPLNPTLSFAKEKGMRIFYLSRSLYRNKKEKFFKDYLRDYFGDVCIIPEGGSNKLAVKGTSEIVESFERGYDLICAPVGTGGTSAGIIIGLNGDAKYLGFSVLKGGGFLFEEAGNLIFKYNQKTYSNWNINLDYHFGGYAKIDYKLIKFMREFKTLNGVELDPIYTGKMLFGIADLINKGKLGFKKILALHTGGLQGVEGMKPKITKIINKNESGE